MAADERRPTGEHPDPETLLAYHEHALAELEADRVQEHLVHCPECAQAVLDFAAFPALEPPSEEHRVTPDELQRRWRDLQVAIAEQERPWWQRHQVLLPLAAAFFAAAVGLAVWGTALRERVAELEGPRGDVYVLDTLRPEGSGGLRGGEPSEIPPWATRVHVYLPLPPGEKDYGAYEVDAASAAGRRVLSGLRVRRSPDGVFVLDLARGELPEGEYRFELFGVEDGARSLLATYPLSIQGPEP